jgi:hypothetical protein
MEQAWTTISDCIDDMAAAKPAYFDSAYVDLRDRLFEAAAGNKPAMIASQLVAVLDRANGDGGTRNVSDNVEGVSQEADAARDAAEKVKHSSETLGSQAEQLGGQVTDFLGRIRAA